MLNLINSNRVSRLAIRTDVRAGADGADAACACGMPPAGGDAGAPPAGGGAPAGMPPAGGDAGAGAPPAGGAAPMAAAGGDMGGPNAAC